MFPGPARNVLALNNDDDPAQQLPAQEENLPVANLRRDRLFRDRLDPLQVPDAHLLRYYRLPRHMILELCQLLTPELEHPTRRSQSLSVMLQVLVGLRFLASGGFQSLIGDIVHVSQSTCSRVLTNFCAALQTFAQDYVRYPVNDANYVIGVKEGFYAIDNMPNVIGDIDCTHVLLMPPKEDKVNYINRKGQTSLNVQVVCDARLFVSGGSVAWVNTRQFYLGKLCTKTSARPTYLSWCLSSRGFWLSAGAVSFNSFSKSRNTSRTKI